MKTFDTEIPREELRLMSDRKFTPSAEVSSEGRVPHPYSFGVFESGRPCCDWPVSDHPNGPSAVSDIGALTEREALRSELLVQTMDEVTRLEAQVAALRKELVDALVFAKGISRVEAEKQVEALANSDSIAKER